MTPYEAFELYVAMKLHFSSEGYDALKYNFKVRTTAGSFLKRPDQLKFNSVLRRYKDKSSLVSFYLAGLLEDHEWIGDMLEYDPDDYNLWISRFEKRKYNFRKDLDLLFEKGDSFNDIFISKGDDKPLIIQLLGWKEITIETVSIVNKIMGNVKEMPEFDKLLWPSQKLKIIKYGSFLPLDKSYQEYLENSILTKYK